MARTGNCLFWLFFVFTGMFGVFVEARVAVAVGVLLLCRSVTCHW